MTPQLRYLAIASAPILLLGTSCQKDELTVVSTATTHDCTKMVVELNVDSILQWPPPAPGEPDLHLTICECDTVAFFPVNIQGDCQLEEWFIYQGQGITSYSELVLDTITVTSELTMNFDDCGPWHHIRIQVDTEPCK